MFYTEGGSLLREPAVRLQGSDSPLSTLHHKTS